VRADSGEQLMTKMYLGDSVYVEMHDHGIWLTTENGLGPSNTIYLEHQVLDALLLFLRQQRLLAENTKDAKSA